MAGVLDDMMDDAGVVRLYWVPVMDNRARTQADAMARVAVRGARLALDTTAHPADVAKRTIGAEGLTQRADKLEGPTADLYGPERLVREASARSVIGANTALAAPPLGVQPRFGYFLHRVGFEIGWGPYHAASVRTMSGPKPHDMLWRRMDAAWTDLMELHEHLLLGTPGLVWAVRRGQVTLVDA